MAVSVGFECFDYGGEVRCVGDGIDASFKVGGVEELEGALGLGGSQADEGGESKGSPDTVFCIHVETPGSFPSVRTLSSARRIPTDPT